MIISQVSYRTNGPLVRSASSWHNITRCYYLKLFRNLNSKQNESFNHVKNDSGKYAQIYAFVTGGAGIGKPCFDCGSCQNILLNIFLFTQYFTAWP